MDEWFAVIRRRGPRWDRAIPLRRQALWEEHAAYVDALEAEGVIRFAGPLDDGDDVLLVCRGESAEAVEARMRLDPWTAAGMLATARIAPWNVLVGRAELEAGPRARPGEAR